ncbi:MAG: hypothetical protein PHQ35_08345 [Phycisphaerae bacterium]|nr:hypothetical protein [Phycisphaerae bacterium]MDD5381499.1 hypothetical protein [Phycisphaerae bacterium]
MDDGTIWSLVSGKIDKMGVLGKGKMCEKVVQIGKNVREIGTNVREIAAK